MQLHPPPIATNIKGEPRLIGIELEYAGLTLPQAAKIVASHFGGEVEEATHNKIYVHCEQDGKFQLEFDVGWVKKLSERVAAAEPESFEAATLGAIENLSTSIMSVMMPYEIITPPMPIAALSSLDKLCRELRAHGAKGTSASPLYAFGTHLNIDMPQIEPHELKRYLAAYFLLEEILREGYKPMDVARRLSPFVDPYPDSYGEVILQPSYNPDFNRLVDDYLEHNPTRNRSLDMLPLFAFYDEPRVRAVVGEGEKINPRPAFHYRLPNCHLDQPDWSVIAEWNRWVEVERLAEDEARLAAMSASWLRDGKQDWRDAANKWAVGLR